jgi:intein-encoded DNA endonuclease-like protein
VIRNPECQKHKYYVIGLRNNEKVLLKDFQNRFEKSFGKSPRIRKDGRCVVNSKKIYHEIIKQGSFYSNAWSLPNLQHRNMKLWLRAFFDCEAWVELNGRKNRRIGLDSINANGLIKIQQALKSIGIESKINENKNRKTRRLQIFGKENLELFEKEVGFLHPMKKSKLREVVISYPTYMWEFPKERTELKIFISKIMKEKARFKKPASIRIVSIIENNLKKTSSLLFDLYGIESRIYKRRNGRGNQYFELMV